MPTHAPLSHHFDLYAYWLSRRGVRIMPARRDLNPGDIPALLPYLMIVEKDAYQFRYRLVGSAIVREIGHDATGSIAGSYFADPGSAAETRAIFECVFRAAHPIFVTGEFCLKSGVNHSMSMLVLPLSDDGITMNMALASLLARFSRDVKASRDWLKGLPIKVSDVIDVSSAEDLKRLCLEWEQSALENAKPATAIRHQATME